MPWGCSYTLCTANHFEPGPSLVKCKNFRQGKARKNFNLQKTKVYKQNKLQQLHFSFTFTHRKVWLFDDRQHYFVQSHAANAYFVQFNLRCVHVAKKATHNEERLCPSCRWIGTPSPLPSQTNYILCVTYIHVGRSTFPSYTRSHRPSPPFRPIPSNTAPSGWQRVSDVVAAEGNGVTP